MFYVVTFILWRNVPFVTNDLFVCVSVDTTEINLIMHNNIRDSLWYAKLTGPSDNPEDLEEYSNYLLVCCIKEHLI